MNKTKLDQLARNNHDAGREHERKKSSLEISSLKEEIKRLQTELAYEKAASQKWIERGAPIHNTPEIEKENQQLREALKEIVKTDAKYDTKSPGVSRLKHCVSVARCALKRAQP